MTTKNKTQKTAQEVLDGRILDRIEKLLALSKSSNVNEAAAAMAKAQELALQYNVDLSRAQTGDQAAQPDYSLQGEWQFTDSEYLMAAKRTLLSIVAKNNWCSVLWTKANPCFVQLFGEKHNVEIAQYLYTFLWRELWRLSEEVGLKEKRPDIRWPTFTKAFYIGASDTLDQRLKDFRAGIQEKGTLAIVVHKDQEFKEAWAAHCATQNYGVMSDIRGAYSKQAGYYSGVAAAKSIDLKQAMGAGQPAEALPA